MCIIFVVVARSVLYFGLLFYLATYGVVHNINYDN